MNPGALGKPAQILMVVLTLGAWCALVACRPTAGLDRGGTAAAAEEVAPHQILTLGEISSDPAGTIRAFQPLADYLARNLSGQGIKRGRVLAAPDVESMVHYLQTGQVDLVFDSPFPIFLLHRETQGPLLVRRWKGGVGTSHTVLVVRKDSGITHLDGLLGKTIAFDDPVSTSGYLLPKVHLEGLGYLVNEKRNTASSVSADEIGYVFAMGEKNVRLWLTQGRTAAAAMRHSDYERLEAEMLGQLAIIASTTELPRHIGLARPTLDDALRARLVELLLGMHLTPDGRATLAQFDQTTLFDPLPMGAEGTMEMLQRVFEGV